MKKLFRPAFGMLAVAAVVPLVLPGAARAAPDLTANISSVTPQPAAPDTQVRIRTRLHNQGSSAADLNQRRGGSGPVIHMARWYFKERGTGPDKFIMAMSMLGTLSPGQSRVLSPSPKIPADARPGTHRICVVVDPENRIRESNERNNRNCASIRVSGRGRPSGPGRPGRGMRRQPDLIVRNLTVASNTVSPGAALKAKALIRNNGNAVAPGTSSGNGYMVDITLGTDTNTPSGYATYSPNYSEDVLLKGGRFSNTTDLAPGTMKSYGDANNEIPSDTPPGNYFVCARVDPGSKVAESNENNNTRCVRIRVVRRAVRPGRGTRPGGGLRPGGVKKIPGMTAKCPGTLGAPRHIAPRNGSKFKHFPRTTRFRWSSVRNAKTYGIEVDCLHCCVQGKWCSDVGKTWYKKDGLTSPQHAHNFVGAQPGRWRVWAVDACGKKGKVSGWWKFEYTR